MAGRERPRGRAELGENPISLLINAISPGIRSNNDYAMMSLVSQMRPSLEDFCDRVVENEELFEEAGQQARSYFGNTGYVENTLRGESPSMGLFPEMSRDVSKVIGNMMRNYSRIAAIYKLQVRRQLPVISNLVNENNPIQERGYTDNDIHAAITGANSAMEIIRVSAQTFIEASNNLPAIAAQTRKNFAEYERHLRDRFVKQDEKQPKKGSFTRIIMTNDPDSIPTEKFVKVKIYQNNPVLTDVLLQLIDQVPEYKEIAMHKKGKTVKTVSTYGVEDVAEKLSAISDPQLLEYIESPSRFFKQTGELLESAYGAFTRLQNQHRTILASDQLSMIMNNLPVEDLTRHITEDIPRAGRDIERIKKMDLDRIVQNEDDVTPDNKMERDVFKTREKLFDLLYNAMISLSQIANPYDRAEHAKETILEAVSLKDEMKSMSMSAKKRKLRADKNADNEYYAGRTKEIGEFYFERRPVPDVKLEEVIGQSFDAAKQHLIEIVETTSYANFMRLSAPGKKVRSNILLIGPYGCGKTELARAICADPRVIGASVSAANTLTAFMHESVNNIKRIYDKAVELRDNSRNLKPVVLVLDEFDVWFAGGNGKGERFTDTDMQQIEDIFLEVLDGMEDYTGIITMAMTNKPAVIPKGIMRRFRHVDIVGELNPLEREQVLAMYLEKSLPLEAGIQANYPGWAAKLEGAPGDVIRKVVDEIHFSLVPPFMRGNPQLAGRIESVLRKREIKHGNLNDKDIEYVKRQLQSHGCIVSSASVDSTIQTLLEKPQISQQITAAKKIYREAHRLVEKLKDQQQPFSLTPSGGTMDF